MFPSSDAVLSFASIMDSYWKLKIDVNSSPLEGEDLVSQGSVLSTARRGVNINLGSFDIHFAVVLLVFNFAVVLLVFMSSCVGSCFHYV